VAGLIEWCRLTVALASFVSIQMINFKNNDTYMWLLVFVSSGNLTNTSDAGLSWLLSQDCLLLIWNIGILTINHIVLVSSSCSLRVYSLHYFAYILPQYFINRKPSTCRALIGGLFQIISIYIFSIASVRLGSTLQEAHKKILFFFLYDIYYFQKMTYLSLHVFLIICANY
jgi:hypothetical protein